MIPGSIHCDAENSPLWTSGEVQSHQVTKELSDGSYFQLQLPKKLMEIYQFGGVLRIMVRMIRNVVFQLSQAEKKLISV